MEKESNPWRVKSLEDLCVYSRSRTRMYGNVSMLAMSYVLNAELMKLKQ